MKSMKLSNRLSNVDGIENDMDICRLIILEMKRAYDGYDYFQCDNKLEYTCLVNYLDLDLNELVLEYPVTVKVYFDHSKGCRQLTSTLLHGELTIE